jgi:molybdenum cofactor biosynthesis protein B
MTDPQTPTTTLGIAILTVSDTRTQATDTSGDTLAARAKDAGHRLLGRRIVKDEPTELRDALLALCDDPAVDVILCTGGTGLTRRDITPEVVESLYDKAIPGFGELFRWLSFQEIGTATLQSRASAGVVRGKLVFALPGSPGACRTAWDKILVHQLDASLRPCNLAELLPRIRNG